MSRGVSEETKTVSSDILIGIAKEFRVSKDYILGLSTVSVQKCYDISELRLSEGAVRGLVTGMIDLGILNRLLERKNFPCLMSLIQNFLGHSDKGIMVRKQVIGMATSSLTDLMKDRPEYRAEAKQDIQFMDAQKKELHTIDVVTTLVAKQIEKVMPLEEEINEQFQQLMKKIIEQVGK